MKKIISLLLALLMAFSLTLPSFAVSEENQKLSAAEVQDALTAAVSAIVDAPADATVVVDEELSDDVADNADTPKEIADILSGFLFVEKEKAEEVAADIVENSKYTVKVIADGKQTVYCSIDFDKFPEIYDARVYLLAIEKIQNKCDEVAAAEGIDIAGDSYSAMSYSHIAGELALHMILASLSKDTASWNPISEWIYERAGVADLNVDEDRIPAVFITTLGDMVVSLLNALLSIIG